MNQHVHSESVRAYLMGKLTAREQADLERAMAADPELAREVALQRAEMAISGMLIEAEVRDWFEQNMKKGAVFRVVWYQNRLLQWAVAAAFALLVAAWWWFGKNPAIPTEHSAPVATVQTGPQSGAVSADSLQAPAAPPAVRPKKAPQYIAMADPADFIPNPALEARIGGVRGDNEAELELQSPAPESAFLLKDGQITLTVGGTLHIDPMPADQPFRLFIYSNRPKDWKNKQALFDRALPLTPAGQGQYLVDFRHQLRLRPGLYYLLVGQQRAPETGKGYRTLWVGKFTVNAKI